MIYQDRRTHLVKPAGETRLPRHHAFLDVETRSERTDYGYREVWRLACCAFMDGDARRGWKEPAYRDFARPFELWTDINWMVPDRGRLVVWCHNLSFDLRASKALAYLPALGFKVAGISLERTATWARFTRGESSILFCDLHSWLPATLREIAKDVKVPLPRKPKRDASDEVWAATCRADVRVLVAAARQILEWLEDEDLGSFRPTGAGQIHGTWRRQFLSCSPLVHDQVEALEAERRAMWTGRCEAWRHGELAAGPYVEFDLPLAYPRIALDCDVPRRLVGRQIQPSLEQLQQLATRLRVLADVSFTTDVECAPAADGEYIRWPVGQIRSWLWDPEISLVLRHATSIEVHSAYLYEPGPVLADAARWIIANVEDPCDIRTPLQRRLSKHWARALIGRVALRYRQWEDWAEIGDEDLGLGLIEDRDTGVVTDLLHVGGQLQTLSELLEADESLPQITGWIMSECRRRLWDLMTDAGLGHVVYLDTDSVIVDQAGAAGLQQRIARDGAWGLRVKATYDRLDVRGPRMLILDDDPRIAGIPKRAVMDAQGDFHAQLFLGLREAVLRRSADVVETLSRSYKLRAGDRRRAHALDGRTRPNTQEVP